MASGQRRFEDITLIDLVAAVTMLIYGRVAAGLYVGKGGKVKKNEAIAVIPLLIIGIAAVAFGDGGSTWPCYHGRQRDNRSVETGLLKAWPKDGPQLIWTASDIGHGYSSVAVVGGHIFTAGMTDEETHVIALDLDGTVLWRRPSGHSWQATKQQRWAVPYAPWPPEPAENHLTEACLSRLLDRGVLMATHILRR